VTYLGYGDDTVLFSQEQSFIEEWDPKLRQQDLEL